MLILTLTALEEYKLLRVMPYELVGSQAPKRYAIKIFGVEGI